ncbi:MAG: GT-D fold domain-containing glycosyltransferase, partial [Neglectibacter timonensis]
FTQDTKISSHTNYNHNFWEKYLINNSLILAKTLDEKYTYGDALITRPFMDTQNKKYSSDIFNLFKQIWNNRDIVIIEGDKTLFGVNNELLNNASTIKRIIAPALNAYDYKNEIIQGDFHKINACKF